MRSHKFVRHKTARDLVEASDLKRSRKEKKIKRILKEGMWAFVDIPVNEDEECEVHLWFRKDQDPRLVALMIGHELGHIADGGPKDDVIGHDEEENRADEFGRAAQEAVTMLLQIGFVIMPPGTEVDFTGITNSGRVKRSR